MNSEKYYTLARDCVRQAEHAATQDEHDKLIEQATVYLMAALAERKLQSPLRAVQGRREASDHKLARSGQSGQATRTQTQYGAKIDRRR
jgi:hypothetical protein